MWKHQFASFEMSAITGYPIEEVKDFWSRHTSERKFQYFQRYKKARYPLNLSTLISSPRSSLHRTPLKDTSISPPLPPECLRSLLLFGLPDSPTLRLLLTLFICALATNVRNFHPQLPVREQDTPTASCTTP